MKVEPPKSADAAAPPAAQTAAAPRQEPQGPAELATEVTTVLAGSSFEERVRAYRSGACSAHELAVPAALLPKGVPILNDEYEWIALNAE